MRSIRSLRSEFHPIVSLLLIGTIFVVLARSMSMPFLAIYLSSHAHLQPSMIGIVLGAGAIAGTVGGFVGGTLSDYLGRKQVLLGTLFIMAFVFVGFQFSTSVYMFLFLNIVLGLGSSFYEPVSKAMMGDLVPAEKRMRVFSLRYLAVNAGFAVGPLIGSFFGLVQSHASFIVTGIVYILYGFVLAFFLRKDRVPDTYQVSTVTVEKVSFQRAVRVIKSDVALRFLLVGGIFSMTVHGQMSVTLSQYLQHHFSQGMQLFAVLMSVNSVTVLVFQHALTKRSEVWKPIKAIVIGSLLLTLGEIGFAMAGGWVLFILAMFLFTIGEIFLVPAEYLALDRLTPDGMRGMYYGVQTLTNLGNFIGPWFGGLLLTSYGGPVMFFAMGAISLFAIYFFWKAQRMTDHKKVPYAINGREFT